MIDNPTKSKNKNNSKVKYEASKPNFLIPSKIDKFLEKKPKKIKYNIDKENKNKIEKIKEKINLLQEILSKNKPSFNTKKTKNSLSKDRIKKFDKKNSLDKETININKNKKINHLNNIIKSPYQGNSNNNFYTKKSLYSSFYSKFNSEQEQQLNDSHHLYRNHHKDYFIKKKIENNSNINKKIKLGDYYMLDLTYREKVSKMRNNGNYSIDKENTSIDKSINFNLLKNNNVKEFDKYKIIKNDTKNIAIQPYNKPNDIKFASINIDKLNNKLNLESKIKKEKEKAIAKSSKNLEEEEININPTSNNSNNFNSILNLTHNNNHINGQIEAKHIDNFYKETPSTKNTLKTETRIIENMVDFKNNKLQTVEISLKNSGRKKKVLNKSVNKIFTIKKTKLINNSSKKNFLDKRNGAKNNHSYENRNKYNININKSKNLNKNTKIVYNSKISKKFSNISSQHFLEINSSPLFRNKYNITSQPSKKNLNKNIISLKKGPINCKLNFNSPLGYFNIKKDYESAMDINKKYKKNKTKKIKHSSFNIPQSTISKIQENYRNNNLINNSKEKIIKTEKNSKTNTYKNNKKINNNLENLPKKASNSSNEKEKEEGEEEKEKECIPHVFSVTLRQSGIKQKEYPNMAKRLSSSQGDISLKIDNFESLRNYNIIYKETKYVKAIESLCKKGFSGPGIKKTNQDNFFIFNNFNNNSNYIYMGVCDGHGIFGQDISSYLVNNLPQNLNKEIINKNIKNLSTEKLSSLSQILESTFIQTNINLNTDERIDSTFSGSTCVTVLFTPTRLICINVGDSRCVMGKLNNNKWYSKNLTRDHKPSEPDEMDRIIASGGKVEAYRDNYGNFVGPERVWKKEGDVPGLAMSRSFGDEVAHTIGVIVNPEINEYQLYNEDKFIILASDGIWEFISSEEVVNIVKDFYKENDIEGALTYLYKEASKRWIMEEEVIDDITIIIVFLN